MTPGAPAGSGRRRGRARVRPPASPPVHPDDAAAQPTRALLLTSLRAAPDGLDAQGLARAAGIHSNTVRWHLAFLTDAGLVRSRVARRGLPGRPRIVYEATRAARTGPDPRAVAGLLAHALARAAGGAEEARDAGRAWGRGVAAEAGPADDPAQTAIDRLLGLLRSLGFRPVADGSGIELREGPLGTFGDEAEPVIRSLHQGVVEGVLAGLGDGRPIGSLEIGCRARPLVLRLDRSEPPADR